MTFVQSLKSVDLEALPLEIKALANIAKRFQTPLSIVVTPQAFEEFATYNSLEPKILNILKTSNNLKEAVARIYLLFITSEIPKELEQAIKEGVRALSYTKSSEAILKQEKPESLMMFIEGSKARYVHPEDVLTAIKHFWALMHDAKTMSKEFHGLNNGFIVIHAIKNWHTTGFAIVNQKTNRLVVKAVHGLLNLNQGITNTNMDSYIVDNNKVESIVVDQTSIIELTKTGVTRRQCLINTQKINDRLILEVAHIAKYCNHEYGCKALMFGISNETIFVLRCYKHVAESINLNVTESNVTESSQISSLETSKTLKNIEDIDINEAVGFITQVEGIKEKEEKGQKEDQLKEEAIQQKIELPSTAESLAITAGNVMVSSLEFASLALKKALKEVTNRDISLELSPQDFTDMASEALEEIGAFLEPDYRDSIKNLLELRAIVLSGNTPSFSAIGNCLDGALKVVKWLSSLKK